jgi:hypothetical protein
LQKFGSIYYHSTSLRMPLRDLLSLYLITRFGNIVLLCRPFIVMRRHPLPLTLQPQTPASMSTPFEQSSSQFALHRRHVRPGRTAALQASCRSLMQEDVSGRHRAGASAPSVPRSTTAFHRKFSPPAPAAMPH